MRISDWSSDVCSSDLAVVDAGFALVADPAQGVLLPLRVVAFGEVLARMGAARLLAVLGGDDGGQRLAEQVLQLEGLDQVGVPDQRAVADLEVGERGADLADLLHALGPRLAGADRKRVGLHGARHAVADHRSEERREGKECVSTCRYGGWADISKTKTPK